jgi:F-type H+-transporting ATPase subunit a
MKKLSFAFLLLLAAGAVRAQDHAPTPAQSLPAKVDEAFLPSGTRIPGPTEVIMPHITDSKHLEYPCIKSWTEWQCGATLPTWNVHVGKWTFDMGPTKHVVWLAIAGAACIALLFFISRAHGRQSTKLGRPIGHAAGFEAILLLLRNDYYMKVLGHGGARFVPFVLTLFFFIAFCNLAGLLPWGSTPTGNVAVTATLAIITFMVVEIAGMRELGSGYLGTVVYWPHNDMPAWGKFLLSLILTPIEILGKFVKPFALTIRLFANMLAGHVIILALISLMFAFGIYAVPGMLMALGIMALEILVAFLQAFIFSLLAAVFIGQIRTAHH